MLNYYLWVIRRPIHALLLILLITLILGGGLSVLVVDNNQDSELPKSDEIVATNDRLDDAFGKKGIVLIGVKQNPNIYNRETLTLIKDLSDELVNIPFVIPDEIRSLSTLQNLKSREWGLERDPFLSAIPNTDKQWLRLREDIQTSKDVFGKLVSTSGTMTAISASLEEGYDQAEVSQAVFDLLSQYRSQGIEFYVAGDAIQAQEIDSGIQQDTGVLLPAALALIAACFFLTLKSLRGIFLPFSVVVLSIVWTMGAMGWLGLAVTVVSSALPALMVAVASSYGIHVMLQYYEQAQAHDSKQNVTLAAIRNIAPAILITGATSALGAITLIVFKVSSIQEFGIATAIGVLSATFLSITFLPAMLTILPLKYSHKDSRSERLFSKLLERGASISLRYRHAILGVTAISLSACCYFGLSQLKYGQDFIEYFEEDHRLRIAFNELNANLGGARYLDVMVQSENEGGMLNPIYLKQVKSFQSQAEALPIVGYSQSFADIITSIHSAMNNNSESFNIIPDTEELIAQYQLLYSMSGGPGEQSSIIDYSNQKLKIRIMLTSSEQEDHKRLYESLKSIAESTFSPELQVDFGGDVMFWLAQIKYIVEGKILNILSSILVVLIFCGLIFRSFSAGLLSITPLTIATILTLSMMGFLGIRLDVGTAIVTAIGVGIGVDFTIHYLKRFLQELELGHSEAEAFRTTSSSAGKAIFYDTLSNVAGFSVFIFSAFQPLQFFGWLISLMMITSAIATLLVFPAIIQTFGRNLIRLHTAQSESTSNTLISKEA